MTLFSKSADEANTILFKEEKNIEKFLTVSFIAYQKAYFDLYSIPLSLAVIAPFVDTENAHQYLQEAEKAFHLIALAHLRKRWEEGRSDVELLDRINTIRKVIEEMTRR